MTREEEYYRYCTQVQYDTYQHEGQPCIEDAIKWADAHPVNPWHKVSEELPKVDKYRKCIKVFARKGDDVFVAFYSPVAGFSLTPSFYVEYALFDIEYWMEIPELPKEDEK